MDEQSPRIPANPIAIQRPGAGQPVVSPTAMSVEEVSRLLSAAGGKRITVQQVQADIDAGAPTNRDGTMNLVHYTAWLVREMR